MLRGRFLLRFTLRRLLLLCWLALPVGAYALGLGELRSEAILGEPIAFDVEILGVEKNNLDASCFRLIPPEGADDLPWLRKATLSFRSGRPAVLEIRSRAALTEPALQVAVYIACGYEISRQFVVFAVPAGSALKPLAATVPSLPPAVLVKPRPLLARPPAGSVEMLAPSPRKSRKEANIAPLPDRLLLSPPESDGLPLRLAIELMNSSPVLAEAQRDILRLEFRMLTALHAQAMTQMETAEKLRNMEGTLLDLQRKSTEFAKRVEKSGDLVVRRPPVSVQPPVIAESQHKPKVVSESEGALSLWSLFGLLAGGLLGGGGWFAWKRYYPRRGQEKLGGAEVFDAPTLIFSHPPEKEADEGEPLRQVDLAFEPEASSYKVTQIDLELNSVDESDYQLARVPLPEVISHEVPLPRLDVAAPAQEDASPATPVIELADIMLSFGRVKGAAQTLRDFLDAYPEESPLLWIKLLEVCRMAGMVEEFETAAREFNHYFNVEIATWGAEPLDEGVLSWEEARRSLSVEDLPRLMSQIVEGWDTDVLVRYLDHLLRDNRSGDRAGFPIPVVEDILFLIELKKTIKRMEQESHE